MAASTGTTSSKRTTAEPPPVRRHVTCLQMHPTQKTAITPLGHTVMLHEGRRETSVSDWLVQDSFQWVDYAYMEDMRGFCSAR